MRGPLVLTGALVLAVALRCDRTQGNVLMPLDGGTCRGLPCGGCCDIDGVCQVGNTLTACGAAANQCIACAVGQVCLAGACALTDGGVDAGPLLCRPCVTSNDCSPPAGVCTQYDNSDYCAAPCTEGSCPPGEACANVLAFNGDILAACVPANGNCGASAGCGTCDAGTSCDIATATCVPIQDGGPAGADAGSCGTLVGPNVPSCCESCQPDSGDCQPNGCYGGWWCNTSGSASCRCNPPPTSCGGVDGGVDAGFPEGNVGPDGGTVTRLYFAVLGDTRPANIDDTDNYPSAIINKIFQEIAALQPPVQFVISTGDYMFATPSGSQGPVQAALYASAAKQFNNGPLFAVMGNQECTGYSDDDCAAGTQGNNNYTAYVSTFVTPLGYAQPYYSVPIVAADQSWTAKVVVIACNGWSDAQSDWLQTTLAQSTTYTFLARHEPLGSDTPCQDDSDPMIMGAPYNQLFTGHTHVYALQPSSKSAIIGNGGAPSTSEYGFITVEQQPGGGFQVVEYDYATAQPLDFWTFQ
jgi:hypothetical protein